MACRQGLDLHLDREIEIPPLSNANHSNCVNHDALETSWASSSKTNKRAVVMQLVVKEEERAFLSATHFCLNMQGPMNTHAFKLERQLVLNQTRLSTERPEQTLTSSI